MKLAANPTTHEISQYRVFDDPLVPICGEPSADENARLAAALQEYIGRCRTDDFSSLTDFLREYPQSPWRAALLTGLGLEYYYRAYYSRAVAAWEEAWTLGQRATNLRGKLLADRAVCELASIYSRLGRMNELEGLLKSVEDRVLPGGAAERIQLAREALNLMRHQPGVSFRCGPLALLSIQRSLNADRADATAVFNAASTHRGFSLPQVAELSRKMGLKYQMAFREAGGEFFVPSVVHWKAGHYAALVRKEGEWYLLEDPTFVNSVWTTREALEEECSGYHLLPAGRLPPRWRAVDAVEGAAVWGKGVTSGIDPDNYTPDDMQAGECSIDEMGMAIARVHLGIVNLQIRDTPVGYKPPVGPSVRFTVRYNHRDYLQPASEVATRFGPKWTHDWHAYIRDTPGNPLADVRHFVGGGGARTFTGFNTNSQTFAPQQFNQARLKRTGGSSYEMTFRDGSKHVYALRIGNFVYLSQVTDPAGNAVTLIYDGSLRLVSLTDAIGQVTTLSYQHPTEPQLITRVTDPFGRFATFDYTALDVMLDHDNNTNTPPEQTQVYALTNITDVLGLNSRFEYAGVPIADTNMVIERMITPYGTTIFTSGQGGGPSGTTRYVETMYPDGSRERVEFNQNTNGIAFSDPPGKVPQGMQVANLWLHGRNTFHWSRNGCAQGYGDYSKAKIYHWLHSPNIATTAGILESFKAPLENRVWLNYAGQTTPYYTVGNSTQPIRVGRVLDDGSTQLFRYAYNGMGHVTESTDPVGRELSYTYSTNEIDLLEVRQTRGSANELLRAMTFNNQHRPLTIRDAAGQTTMNTYNSRGQLLTSTNPKGEKTTFTYDPNGYLIQVDGPLPGTNDLYTATYDSFGRLQSWTDESGYMLLFEYDALDRLTRVTYPDATYTQYAYNRLDLAEVRDSAGRHTKFEYDSVRQVTKRTDPLGRETRFEWCVCGRLGSLTDPMGRRTEWHSDVQGRLISKQYGDGAKVKFVYENSTSRLRNIIDEKQQAAQYTYNRDDTLKSIAYANATVPTPVVDYTYDPDYERVTSMTDGTGTTFYSYVPIAASPTLGAGAMASIDGPLDNDTITYGYDERGWRILTSVNGISSLTTYDAAGRVVGETNALGQFAYGYANHSGRLISRSLPNGQSEEREYGNALRDFKLERITHRVGGQPLSEFLYANDVAADRIATWSQQAGAQSPDLHTFGYDAVNQLLAASVTNAGSLVRAFSYTYDPAGNRLSEQIDSSNHTANYNALNQLSSSTAPGISRTNEWDAADRLVAINSGSDRTELTYDGLNRLASIRLITNGVQASFRRLLWSGETICEERDADGVVTKRFFEQGMKVETGPNAESFYYTRDHLGSIREVTDAAGDIRARYTYDPYGRRTRTEGNIDSNFGFAGMFWSREAGLSLTLYRAYDAESGRWLSRDPLPDAELIEGPNLYAYVANNPLNLIDPYGLMSTMKTCLTPANAAACTAAGLGVAKTAQEVGPRVAPAANALVCREETT